MKNSGDNFSDPNWSKAEWKNPKVKKQKIMQPLPAPVKNINLPKI